MVQNNILNGVTVLDLSRVLAGPYCGMLLADMGATVIKVEMPKVGDDSRAMGPFLNGESVYYMNFNRGKLGCTLNLKAVSYTHLDVYKRQPSTPITNLLRSA